MPDLCDLKYPKVFFDVLSKKLQTAVIVRLRHRVVFCVPIEFCSFRQSTIEKYVDAFNDGFFAVIYFVIPFFKNFMVSSPVA